MDKIAILGSGSWGTALGKILAEKGYTVFIWGRNKNVIEDININRENSRYLKSVKLPASLNATENIEEALQDADIVILAVTSQSNRETLNRIKNLVKDSTIIVNVSKGLEINTNKRASEISEEILPYNKFVALSGPSHAEEVAVNMPTTIVSASRSGEAMIRVQ